ncbi:MAG: histidinol dehydrogenase, partial [Lachnospiraceae bacterium]|nr:histidinol dehydrogenase [Lachnospiraceae bacterium]
MRTVKLNKETKKDILANLLKRSTNDYGEIEERVKSIIERVRTEGDSAVYDYARQFDRCDLNDDNFMVTEAEIEEGAASIDSKLYEVMERSFANIRSYHEKQV